MVIVYYYYLVRPIRCGTITNALEITKIFLAKQNSSSNDNNNRVKKIIFLYYVVF